MDALASYTARLEQQHTFWTTVIVEMRLCFNILTRPLRSSLSDLAAGLLDLLSFVLLVSQFLTLPHCSLLDRSAGCHRLSPLSKSASAADITWEEKEWSRPSGW